MKYIHLLAVIAVIILSVFSGLVALACSAPGTPSSTPAQTGPTGNITTTVPVPLGNEFTLNVGQRAVVQDEDLKIGFLDVVSDSRCPHDVTCIWEGEAGCLVEVTTGNLAPQKLVLTQPGLTDQSAVQDYVNFTFAFRIEPYPEQGEQIAIDDYRLVMTVTKKPLTSVEFEPAPIHDLKITVTVSGPPEILVYVQGGLRNTCVSFHRVETVRNGNTVNITVTNQVTTGVFCGQVYTYYDRCVNLGDNFVSGQVYTIIVNDRTTSFTMP